MFKLAPGSRGVSGCVIRLRPAACAFMLMICACAPALAASGKCKLGKFAELPVTMAGGAETTAKINGTEVKLIIDTGSFNSALDAGSAAALGLHIYAVPATGFKTVGIGGEVAPSLAMAKEFTLPGGSLENVEFIVGGTAVGGQNVGVLGRDILQLGDAEYDFARGVARLMKAQDCSDAMLAYWVRAGDSYSVINIVQPEKELVTGSYIKTRQGFKPAVIAVAYLNGAPIRAMFDSGAPISFVSAKAAAKAGIKIDSPGVVPAGDVRGFGSRMVASYIAPVGVFKIGDEEIRNTQLRLGDTEVPGADMLVGADFFLSHHIYVANSQEKLYFTYNGGPVFDLRHINNGAAPGGQAPGVADASSIVGDPPASAAAQDPNEESKAAAAGPDDAAELSRRGAAMAARGDYDHALTALSRACELAPDNAEYFYERSRLYLRMGNRELASKDLDQTLKLDPRSVAALVSRAELLVANGDKTGAEADLDAASRIAAKQDDARLEMAAIYERADLPNAAIAQYDLWIPSHVDDARVPRAQNSRCFARALVDSDLPLALKDCDAALNRASKGSHVYANASDSRGLVFLRLGDYAKSIADYDAAITIEPKSGWSWYGRGIDKLRQHQTAAGAADIAQAKSLQPKIDETFAHYGILP